MRNAALWVVTGIALAWGVYWRDQYDQAEDRLDRWLSE